MESNRLVSPTNRKWNTFILIYCGDNKFIRPHLITMSTNHFCLINTKSGRGHSQWLSSSCYNELCVTLHYRAPSPPPSGKLKFVRVGNSCLARTPRTSPSTRLAAGYILVACHVASESCHIKKWMPILIPRTNGNGKSNLNKTQQKDFYGLCLSCKCIANPLDG